MVCDAAASKSKYKRLRKRVEAMQMMVFEENQLKALKKADLTHQWPAQLTTPPGGYIVSINSELSDVDILDATGHDVTKQFDLCGPNCSFGNFYLDGYLSLCSLEISVDKEIIQDKCKCKWAKSDDLS